MIEQRFLIGAAIALLGQFAVAQDAPPRMVTLGASATETVFALGAGDRVVGVDTSSTYPQAATQLPQVGSHRAISAEGVLSLAPTLVIASHEVGPPEVLDQIAAAGVRVVRLPAATDQAGVESRIRMIAESIGMPSHADFLIEKLADDFASASRGRDAHSQPKVLFLYIRGRQTLMVSGRGTAAHSAIEQAGGQNAAGTFEGYKPMTAEAVIEAAPDVLLALADGVASIGGIDELLKLPGVALTPAGQARRVLTMDDVALLGAGPRTGEAIAQLARQLHDPTAAARSTHVAEATQVTRPATHRETGMPTWAWLAVPIGVVGIAALWMRHRKAALRGSNTA